MLNKTLIAFLETKPFLLLPQAKGASRNPFLFNKIHMFSSVGNEMFFEVRGLEEDTENYVGLLVHVKKSDAQKSYVAAVYQSTLLLDDVANYGSVMKPENMVYESNNSEVSA